MRLNHAMRLNHLRCEYQTCPLGIDRERPRLSWIVEADAASSSQRGARQTAYQILAATRQDALAEGSADLWDSGKVASDQSTQISYSGKLLASAQRAWWTARAWDENDNPSAWAELQWWETGLLNRTDWHGQWIGGPLVGGPRTSVPCPFLRADVSLAAAPVSARLYITALGVYECHINGQVVGDQVFAPGWTDYRKRVQYQTYDVTGMLQPGKNAIGAILGDGWCCGFVGFRPRQQWADRPRLLAELRARFADGSEQVFSTDKSWRAVYGPMLQGDLLMGESYDARLELDSWDMPGYDDAEWFPARTFHDPGIELCAPLGPPVRRQEELAPIADPVARHGRWIFDLGQNMVGRVRIRARGPAATTLVVRHAEILDESGGLYTANLRYAKATEIYTKKSDGEEVYEPRFTFHGFRYVEIEGLRETPARDTVTGIVLHSDMTRTGSFECSEPLINQLQHNIEWGQKGNFLEVPTDCPQRDERLGWTGDAQVFIRTASFNRDVAGFFTKWMRDMRDAQSAEGGYPSYVPTFTGEGGDGGPAWADAGIICPWTIYQRYGDLGMLAEQYESLKRYLGQQESTSRDLIRCYEGYPGFSGYGDWLTTDKDTPKDLIGTAFFANSARLLSRIASVLGKEDDTKKYEALRERIEAAFQARFIGADGAIDPPTQTAYVLALHFGLMPHRLRQPALDSLVNDIESRRMHLATGFVGTSYLPHVLADGGRLDIAYALLHQKSWPSWLYAVTQGATTIWERWDGWTHDKGFQNPGMNSFNHYAYGAIGDWLYASVAGIDIDPDKDRNQPGYKRIVLRPRPGGGLTRARGSLTTPYGEIVSDWRIEDGMFHWTVAVPANTTAAVHVPARDSASVGELEHPERRERDLRLVREEPGCVVYEAVSGTYRFRAPLG